MKIEQTRWTEAEGWEPQLPDQLGEKANLVLIFGDRTLLTKTDLIDHLQTIYPNAYILGCSTAGEIYDTEVTDDALVITAIQLEKTPIQGTAININNTQNSFEAGKALAKSLDLQDLTHVFVISDGLNVNGSELVKGLTQHLPPQVTITGGLSGDGSRFAETLVLWDTQAQENTIAAIAFYGNHLEVGYGSWGGWDAFGPERIVTHAQGNILYKLDGKSVLELYKKYLGEEYAGGLPATGLLFPLSLRFDDEGTGIVRTILAIDEAEQSLTFAGDVPEGSRVRFMKANFDRLVDGAQEAAEISSTAHPTDSPQLAILISCVGRKLVLKQRIEEEVEVVREVMGNDTILAGFYSYGEICPFKFGVRCELHNQTMTITTLREVL